MPSEPHRPVIVVGTGRMGSVLVRWLTRIGPVPPSAVISRRRQPATRLWDDFLGHLEAQPPTLILLAIPDDALPAAAQALARARSDWRRFCVLHTSGARAADVLAPLRRRGAAIGSLHPMMTFPAPSPSAVSPRSITFSLEGDPAARRAAATLVRAWGGSPLVLTASAKTSYHLAATLVGPGAVVQMAAAHALLRQAGLRGRRLERAQAGLLDLLAATAQNLHHGPAAAFTGPWARGDVDTVKIHQTQLRSPSLRRLYPALAAASRELLAAPSLPQIKLTRTSKNKNGSPSAAAPCRF